MLSPAGVRRDLLYAADQVGALAGGAALGAAVVDEALGRLAEWSLLAFTVDGQAVLAHRLVMRVIREQSARRGSLAAICQAAVAALEARAQSLSAEWRDRPAYRDLVEQISALHEQLGAIPGFADTELTASIVKLRLWAVWLLAELGDSPSQAHQGFRVLDH